MNYHADDAAGGQVVEALLDTGKPDLPADHGTQVQRAAAHAFEVAGQVAAGVEGTVHARQDPAREVEQFQRRELHHFGPGADADHGQRAAATGKAPTVLDGPGKA